MTPFPLTEFAPRDEKFTSQYGYVSNEVWCQKEIERFAKSGRTVVLITDDKDRIALGQFTAPIRGEGDE